MRYSLQFIDNYHNDQIKRYEKGRELKKAKSSNVLFLKRNNSFVLSNQYSLFETKFLVIYCKHELVLSHIHKMLIPNLFYMIYDLLFLTENK